MNVIDFNDYKKKVESPLLTNMMDAQEVLARTEAVDDVIWKAMIDLDEGDPTIVLNGLMYATARVIREVDRDLVKILEPIVSATIAALDIQDD